MIHVALVGKCLLKPSLYIFPRVYALHLNNQSSWPPDRLPQTLRSATMTPLSADETCSGKWKKHKRLFSCLSQSIPSHPSLSGCWVVSTLEPDPLSAPSCGHIWITGKQRGWHYQRKKPCGLIIFCYKGLKGKCVPKSTTDRKKYH